MSTRMWIISILAGIFFRLWIGSFATRTMIFDMSGYEQAARDIVEKGLIVDCCYRNNGYPLFLAAIRLIVGPDPLTITQIIQGLMDTSSACILYIVSRRLFGKISAMITYLLYISNPITSSYTGLQLGEILTIHFVCILLFLLTYRSWKHSPTLWIATGSMLGLLLFVKQSFLSFTVLALLLLPWHTRTWKKRSACFLLLLLGYLIGNMWTILGNQRQFHIWALTPPYNSTWMSLYSGLYMPRWPEIDAEYARFSSFPQEYKDASLSYTAHIQDHTYQISTPYKNLFFDDLSRHPLKAMWMYAKHAIWTWDKYHAFYYHDPWYPDDIWIIRTINIIWIITAIHGMYVYTKQASWLSHPFFCISLILLCTVTCIFPLVNNETRLTLYAYPIIFIFSGYGFSHKKIRAP